MATFRIEVDGDELRCSFPFDQDLNDALASLGGRWQPKTKGTPGAWVVPISAEAEVAGMAERAGYDVEVI